MFSAMPWLLLDTTFDGPPLVIQSDGVPKAWVSAQRASKDLWPGLRREEQMKVLAAAASTGRSGDVNTFRVPSGALVAVVPVLGPHDAVCGVSVGVAAEGEELGAPPAASGYVFDANRRMFHAGEKVVEAMGGRELVDRNGITFPEVLRYIHVPDAFGMMMAVLNVGNLDKWSGAATIEIGGRAVHLWTSMSRRSTAVDRWTGVIHVVRDDQHPSPSFDAAALSAVTALQDRHPMCVLDLHKARLMMWMTDPPPGIQWKGTVDDRDTPHPDDVVRIFQAVQSIFVEGRERAEVTGVRLRRVEGGWTVVDCTGSVVRQGGAPVLAFIEMVIAGESFDPDPTESPEHTSPVGSPE